MSTKENIYTDVIYGVIGRARPQESGYDAYRNRRGEPGNNVMSGLVLTGHHHLVGRILSYEGQSDRVLRETSDAYFSIGEFRKVLDLLRQYPQLHHRIDTEAYINGFIHQKDDALLLDFVDYMNNNTPLSHVLTLMVKLWETKQFGRARAVIPHTHEHIQKILLFVHAMYEGEQPTPEAVQEVMEYTYMESTDPKISQRIQYFLLSELDRLRGDIPIVEVGIITYEQCHPEKSTLFETSNLYNKVRQYHYDRGEFAEVENFLQVCGDSNYYSHELVREKLRYAIKTHNQDLHRESLNVYREQKERELKEFRNALDEPYLKKDWEKRFEALEIQALIYCQEAIFVLLHGDIPDGQDNIKRMIESAESILKRFSENKEKTDESVEQHRAHAKKVLYRLKKNLKEEFFRAGILHMLPRENVWRDAIKDPEERRRDGKNSVEKREQRSEMFEQKEEKRIAEQESEKTQYIRMMLEDNRVDDAIQSLVEETEWISAKRGTWERGMLILDHRPESFGDLFRILSKRYLSKDDSYDDSYNDYTSFAQFWVKGYQLGMVQPSDWAELAERIKKYQYTGEGGRTLPHELIVSLTQYLIASGDIEHAWTFFQSVQNRGSRSSLSRTTASETLYHLVRAVTNRESRDGSYLAFNNIDIGEEDIPHSERMNYWNTKANMACMYMDDGEYVKSQEELKNTILKAENPFTLLRMWCRYMVQHPIRNPHQVKNEMTSLLHSVLENSDMTQEDITMTRKIRMRIVTTLMDLSIPGMEASTEVKKTDTLERVQHFWFQRLLQKHYLSQGTERFLGDDWREHIQYLRRLLAQHQNEFNTVIDTLNGASFKSSEWKNVFTVLSTVGVMTPGIWSQARSVNFDPQKLRELEVKIKNTKKVMFTNTPLPNDLTPALRAELIYHAFKPVNMSYEEVLYLIGQFSDCTRNLDKYSFPRDGYLINISERQNVVLRRGEVEDTVLDSVRQFLGTNISILGGEKSIQNVGRNICEAGRLKIDVFDTKIDSLLFLFIDDNFFTGINTPENSRDNNRYQYIRRLKDFLDVYLVDTLESRIHSFFQNTQEYTSSMWAKLVESMNTPKKRKNLEQQLKITLPSSIDSETASHIIAQVILQKSKVLQSLRKSVNQELKKYVQITDGGEIPVSDIKLRVYTSKNQASFFAKASAGLCTHRDVGSFMREDHFHFNLIDEAKQECVGNLMAYEVNHNGEKILLLRGFNPNTTLLKFIDIPSYCNAMIQIAEQFAKDNHFSGVYMSENSSEWHALSNRREVLQYLMKQYGSFEKGESCNFPITGSKSISTIYPILKFPENRETR